MSVTSLLASIPIRRRYFALAVYLLFSPVPNLRCEPGQEPPDSLVKVIIESRVAILDDRNMSTAIRVQQRTPFTGLVIDDRGHVVAYIGMRWWPAFGVGRAKVLIETRDGRRVPAEVVGIDERISLAVLESRSLRLQAIRFHELPEKGQLRFLNLGKEDWRSAAPFMVKLERNPMIAKYEVRVSGLGKAREGWEGGVILDKNDRALGLITGAREYPFTKAIGVWEVLPVDVVRASADRILKTRKDIKSAWLGVFFDEAKTGQPVIKALAKGGPAQKAGLQPGDVVLKIKDQPVPDFGRLVDIIRWSSPGRAMPITVQRNDQPQELSVVLSDRKDQLPVMQWTVQLPPAWDENSMAVKPRILPAMPPIPFQLGLELDPLTAKLAAFFKCPENQGLLVKDVRPNSLAEKAGFQVGDVLIKINDSQVGSPTDFQHSLTGGGSVFEVQFVRDGRVQKTKLILP